MVAYVIPIRQIGCTPPKKIYFDAEKTLDKNFFILEALYLRGFFVLCKNIYTNYLLFNTKKLYICEPIKVKGILRMLKIEQMNTKAEKAQLTREINALKSYIGDLKGCVNQQGEKHFYDFSSVKMERWMYLGDYFYLSTIETEERNLRKLEARREEMDTVKKPKTEIESINEKIKEVQDFFKGEIDAGNFSEIKDRGSDDVVYIQCHGNTFGFWDREDHMTEFQAGNTLLKLNMTESELKALHNIFTKSILNDKKQKEIKILEAKLKALKGGE